MVGVRVGVIVGDGVDVGTTGFILRVMSDGVNA